MGAEGDLDVEGRLCREADGDFCRDVEGFGSLSWEMSSSLVAGTTAVTSEL